MRKVIAVAIALCAVNALAVEHAEVTKAARLPFKRGMGFDGYWQNRNRKFMTDPDLYRRLVAKGFDHIRLPVDFNNYIDYNASTDKVTLKENVAASFSWTGDGAAAGFAVFDKVIDYAIDAGLYVYLDFHGLDETPYANDTNPKKFVATWKAVAERYKDRSNKLIFELWNEPHYNYDADQVCSLQRAAIAEIRKTNPTRLILFGAPGGGGSWTLTHAASPARFDMIQLPEKDNNLAVVVHEYAPGWFTHQGLTWVGDANMKKTGFDEQYCTGTNSSGVAQYTTARQELLNDLRHPQAWVDWSEVPLVINEFNVASAQADPAEITKFLEVVTRFCESNNIPWAPWIYYETDRIGFNCYDKNHNMLDSAKAGLFPDLVPTDEFAASMYAKAVDITFSGYTGSTALANFPVLVKLSETTVSGFKYADFKKPGGADLCFTDASGNLLAHEIDTWDPDGVSTVWVKVPSLTSSTKIVARYGCAKPIVRKVESVWDSDYVGVWHLGERKLPLADSSNESRDVTSRDGEGVALGAAGAVGGSVDFGAPNSSRSLNVDDHRLLDGFTNVTIEAWTKQAAHAANAGILSKRTGNGSQMSYFMYDNGSGTTMKYSGNGTSSVDSNVNLKPELGRWNHQAYSLDASKTSSNSKGYLNGALKGTGSVSLSGSKVFAGSAELHVGNFQSDDSRNFPGSIDEVRISKCVRSADWIKASYDTVANAAFATYKLQGASSQDPTLYIAVDRGATNTLASSEVKTWTTKIVKDGEGTVVVSPVSGTTITNLTVLGGTVRLASSAPTSVISKIGEHAFASGTGLDLSGKSYTVAKLKGAPSVKNAATFAVSGSWTLDVAETMSVAGSLVLTGASVVVPDESIFADVGHSGVAIATATGGITGVPSFTSDDFALKLSADGKSLLLYYIATDSPEWATFAKSITVTFAGYSGASTLEDFPVLVRLSPAISGFSYADFQKPNGGDLRFADSNGNLIPHEIDTWNPSGESTVWVKVPSFAKNGTIKAYYGCAHPVKALLAKDVWDDGYVGVWHLGERALPLKESSETSVDFTAQTGTTVGYAAAGIVGGSVDMKNKGSNAVVTPKSDKLDGFEKFTIEAWEYQNGTKSKASGILSKRQTYNFEDSYYIQVAASGTNATLNVGTNRLAVGRSAASCAAPAGKWNHVAYSVDMTTASQNARSFMNGVRKARNSITFFDKMPCTDSVLVLGNLDRQGWDGVFNGKIDEVRISKVDRSDDWLKATYETIAKSGFATYAMSAEPAPDPNADPVASNFSKFMTVFFRGAQYGTSLTNFPVLVKLSTAISGFSYSDFKKPNGGDLRFADSDGNWIPHEIDTWNSNGVSTVWVKVPLLTRTGSITAYYGATNPGRAPVAKDVWDSDYVGVWHLGESALPLKESTGVSTDFSSKTGTVVYAAAGAVGGSVDFSTSYATKVNSVFAGDDNDLDGFSDFTIETWTYQNAFYTDKTQDQYAGILGKRNGANTQESFFVYQSGLKTYGNTLPKFSFNTNSTSSARETVTAKTLPLRGQWLHSAFTRKASSGAVNVYFDGTNNYSATASRRDKVYAGSAPLSLGWVASTHNTFPGKIDEVRISKTARSKEWIKATHDTIANDTFSTCLVGGNTLPSDTAVSNVLLKAKTDKANPIDYVENENVRFDFFLDGVDMLPQAMEVKQPLYVIWTRTADDGVTVKGTNTISLTQGFSVTTKLAIPGIVKMTGDLVGNDYKKFSYIDPKDGKTTKYVSFGGGAGVATEKMQLSTVEPTDFDRFWADAKAKLATVPFPTDGSELTEVFPKTSNTNSYRYYAAKIPCYGPRPVTGWLVVPRRPSAGGIPVHAGFDGYGCISKAPNLPSSSPGQKIYFAVNAHGYDMIGHDDQYYKDFNDYINKTNRTFNGTTYTYGFAPQDYDNPTNTYFYYMALRVVRAFEYLKSRPEWNGRDVIAEGGSQGGLQTMWAGGLVDGITKIRPSITWGCDIGCPFNGKSNTVTLLSRTWGIPCVPGAFYFDSALHAKRVPRNCIAEITRVGLADYTSPPRGVLMSYYNMKCQVSAKLVQGSDHGYSPPQPNQTFTISKEAQTELDRILYVNVEAGVTNTLIATDVTSYITNIVKQGAGTLVASAIPNYSHRITVEGGVWQGGANDGDFGAAGTVVDVLDGASLVLKGSGPSNLVANVLSGRTVNLYGDKDANALGKIQVVSYVNRTIGENVAINLKDADEILYLDSAVWCQIALKSGTIDLGGKTLTVSSNWKKFNVGATFRNGGVLKMKATELGAESGYNLAFEGTGKIVLNNSMNVKVKVDAPGWTIEGSNSGIRGNVNRNPSYVDEPQWTGPVKLTGSSNIANYSGDSTGTSNTVFNLKGPFEGSGNLAIGPGWVNLHNANNTYSGNVTVKGRSGASAKQPILAGGGGIGLWNGAACFPSASSVTFTNTARLAFMDTTACSVPNVKFVALAGETQSISGGVYTARSTIAGITKTGAGTLIVDSPAKITGLADIQAGTLKIAYAAPVDATQEGVLAPHPQFASLKFASGTTLDLSDNVGFVVGDLDGSPSVVNSGLFGVTGKWTLRSPSDKLTVAGENAMFGEQSAAGCLAFQGATFEIPSDLDATFVAAANANGGKLEVARANWVVSQLGEGATLPMPTASAATNPRWSMSIGPDGRSVLLVLAPIGGYSAWASAKNVGGKPADMTKGIANAVRYAFDIDPDKGPSEIGTPIMQVVRDAAGNPSVQSRDLATGRDDVTFGILATPDLTDWSNAALVPMTKFATDGLWKPTASGSAGYVYPAKMFFKYKVDIQE